MRKMLKHACEKTMAILFLTFIVMALTPVSIPVVSAKTLLCVHIIDWNWWGINDPDPRHSDAPLPDGYWKGTITGGITGTIYFWGLEKTYVVGKTEHFFEDFYIDLGKGEWILGHDEGIWSFVTFKYMSNGWVTDASLGCKNFIGCKLHSEGTSTNPFDEEGNLVLPIHGVGTSFISP